MPNYAFTATFEAEIHLKVSTLKLYLASRKQNGKQLYCRKWYHIYTYIRVEWFSKFLWFKKMDTLLQIKYFYEFNSKIFTNFATGVCARCTHSKLKKFFITGTYFFDFKKFKKGITPLVEAPTLFFYFYLLAHLRFGNSLFCSYAICLFCSKSHILKSNHEWFALVTLL